MNNDPDPPMWTGQYEPALGWMRLAPEGTPAPPSPPSVPAPPSAAPTAPSAAAAEPWHLSAARPAAPVYPGQGEATVVGQARGIHNRAESDANGRSVLIWTFRVERYDRTGNRLSPVPVEMRGRGFEGLLSDGDDVRVSGNWKNGTLRSKRIENLTTNALVRAKPFPWKVLIVSIVVALAMVIGVAAWAISDNASFHNSYCQSARDHNMTAPGC